MPKQTDSAAGGAMPASGLTQSRRGLLTALAAAPLIGAAATSAIAEGDDTELFRLEAEIMRLPNNEGALPGRINHTRRF